MRIAAIYDIHGNLPALEAVIEEIISETVDIIVVGGDVIAGPMPSEALALLQSLSTPTHFIFGNAESELLCHLVGKEPETSSKRAAEETHWNAETLTGEQKKLISDWPATFEHESEALGSLLFCHATPDSDTRVFTPHTPENELFEIFSRTDASLVICGHTHMPFDLTIGTTRVVNAGSVGMPFGNTGADWLLLDKGIKFKHTAYDLEAAAERIRISDYPYAKEFAANNVLQSLSEEQALNMLSQIEADQKKKI